MTEVDARGVIVTCPSCQQRNRVPYGHQSAQATKCKKCGTLLPAASEPIEVPTAEVFDALVGSSSLPVVVDFWAPWCGPCRMVAPTIDQLAVELAGRVRFAKMNVDENPATSARFGIRSIPTLLVFKDGREIDRIVGVQPKAAIAARLERVS